MSTDKVSGDSRFDAGRKIRMLADHLYEIADEGIADSDKTAAEVIAEMRESLIGSLLPLLGKAHDLLNIFELDLLAWASAKAALRKELDTWK